MRQVSQSLSFAFVFMEQFRSWAGGIPTPCARDNASPCYSCRLTAANFDKVSALYDVMVRLGEAVKLIVYCHFGVYPLLPIRQESMLQLSIDCCKF